MGQKAGIALKVRSADLARAAQNIDQHFGHRLVKLDRDFLAQFDIGQGASQGIILLDRNAVFARDLDDLAPNLALALGNDRRGALLKQSNSRKR